MAVINLERQTIGECMVDHVIIRDYGLEYDWNHSLPLDLTYGTPICQWVIKAALRDCAYVGNAGLADRFLRTGIDFGKEFIATLMHAALEENHTNCLALFVRWMNEDHETAANKMAEESCTPNDYATYRCRMQESRVMTLGALLDARLWRGPADLTKLVLETYLDNLDDLTWVHGCNATKILEAVPVKMYMLLSRKECFKYLRSNDMPAGVYTMLLRRLQIESEGNPIMVEIKAGGKSFNVYEDILCHWSPYFQGLSRHAWSDRGKVDFGDI
ncbi:hypothetical protein BJX99DRAFT_254056 [Aspergillus californicus]